MKKVVKFQANHRFDNDLEFSKLMDRYTKNEWIEEDINTINSRIIDGSIGMIPPKMMI